MKDEKTSQTISFIEANQSHLLILDDRLDTMDYGNHDFYAHELVIDPTAYQQKKIKRGEVILYEQNDDVLVARVIALPGETISIKKGQIFIDRRRLDAFYGKAHRLGYEKDEYEQVLKEIGRLDHFHPDLFEPSMEELTLEQNQYFVMGDDWLRGSREMIDFEQIVGEVLGYKQEQ
ncbi:signal peptidase I [Bacillus sp. FJAT-50079]|uniref:signal peptidase I n=1 Tax=Bacillus sp. FJAT-50079 TaxID=2833577 RepID=UPI001BC9F212|nr:signal peptidase I [Bacillus sp. FJAT-50079]MBS4207436.1 signal peptidase I [Bacillus sp. FJAT-50079]